MKPFFSPMKCLFGTFAIFVFIFSTTLAQVQVVPESLQITLSQNESESVDLEIINSSDETVLFSFPGYESFGLTNTNSFEFESNDLYRSQLLKDVTRGKRTAANELERSWVNEFNQSFELGVLSGASKTNSGYRILIDNESLQGFEFKLASQAPLSGNWTGYFASLELTNYSGATYANDLTILLTDGPELSSSNIIYQLGGNYANFGSGYHIPFQTGDSSEEQILEEVQFNQSFSVDGLYAWIGNGWNDFGTWDGEVVLYGLGGLPSFISEISPSTGEIAPNSSVFVSATFVSGDMLAGEYSADLNLEIISESSEVIVINTTLNVLGNPKYSSDTFELNFGQIIQGFQVFEFIEITNQGNSALILTNIASDNADFVPFFTQLEIPAFSSDIIPVAFNAGDVGIQSGMLTFNTNDELNQSVEVSLLAESVAAPIISLTPEALFFDLDANETAVLSFQIENNGDGPLDFFLPQFEGLNNSLSSNNELNRTGFLNYNFSFLTPENQTSKQDRNSGKARISEINYITDEVPADLQSSGSYVIEFENLELAGHQFVPFNEVISGELSMISGNFELVANESSVTWADDLTILIFDTNDFSQITNESIILQIGGSIPFSSNQVFWGGGQSSAPGTKVQSSIILETPISLNEAYVWIGNGFNQPQTSTWTGNVVLYGVGNEASFIVDVNPLSGTVLPGESQNVEVMVSSVGLIEGVFTTEIGIFNNDPSNPIALLPVTLSVNGTPEIQLSSSVLDFGDVFENDSKVLNLSIINNGSGSLNLFDFELSNDAFATNVSTIVVAPLSSKLIPITFTAGALGVETGELTFSTNVASNELVTVSLTAVTRARPLITVDVSSLEFDLSSGEASSATIVLSNNGNGVLDFNLPRFVNDSETASERFLSKQNMITQRVELPEALDTMMKQDVIDERLSAEVNENEAIQSITDAHREVSSERSGNANSLHIGFEDLALASQEFILTGDRVSGSLTGIEADFVINQASGITWASDLTVLITTTPNVNEFNHETVILQIGGTISYSSNKIFWGMGNSSTPGTRIVFNTELNTPIGFEDVYVWLGNAWVEDAPSSWSGTITLHGISSTVPFITNVNPSSGSLDSGESIELNISVSSEGLNTGAYLDTFVILSNDPLSPSVEIFGTLNVTGIPQLSVTPQVVDFDTVFTGGLYTANVLLTNSGTDVLNIENAVIEGVGFSHNFEPVSISPGLSSSLSVKFETDSPGDFTGTLSFESNADNNVTVQLLASAVNPGILSTETTAINVELAQDEMVQQTITLTNTGESDLIFTAMSLRLENSSTTQSVVPSRKENRSAEIFNSEITRSFPGFAHELTPKSSLLNDSGLETLWYQPVSGINGIMSTNYAAQGIGIYSTDDFFISDGALIEVITTYGSRFTFAGRLDELASGFTFYIYPDDNGKPAGNPDDGLNAHIFKYDAGFSTNGFTLFEDNGDDLFNGFVELNITQATGSPLFLADGRYWLTVHLNANGNLENAYAWYIFSGIHPSSDAMIIDPSDFFSFGLNEWTPINFILPNEQSNLAFKLEGVSVNFLSVNPAQGQIAPGESLDIDLMIDASNLMPGSYDLTLRFMTNSTVTPTVDIPVLLTVTEGGNGLLWVNLHYPSSIEFTQGDTFSIHGLAIPVEELSDNAQANIKMWVGFHSNNIHPGLWEEEVWIQGDFLQSHNEVLEFVAQTGSHLPIGDYYFATRFQMTDNNFMYGGFHEAGGGFWNPLFHKSGTATVLQSTSVENPEDKPERFVLNQNYPNPFNPTTTIRYELPEAAEVRLDVFNIQGQRVASLVNNFQNAGFYNISFDASQLSSGVYIYRLQAGSYSMVRKMTLLK